MQASDIDLWELNEAFATVVLDHDGELDVPHERMNVNGGAVPWATRWATGAMILGTVLDELRSAAASARRCQPHAWPRAETAMIIERVWPREGAEVMTTEIIRYAVDEDGIAVLTLDYPGKTMDVIDQAFMDSLEGLYRTHARRRPGARRHRITSGKDSFVAGPT